MITIHKYDVDTVWMPAGAKILSVGSQSGSPVIWAEVNTDNELEQRTFDFYGTGWEIKEPNRTFIGTVIADYGFVWHIFEIKG